MSRPTPAQLAACRRALEEALGPTALLGTPEALQDYGRDESGMPGAWVRSSKRAMMSVIPRFNMRRVLFDYMHGLYLPAAAAVAIQVRVLHPIGHLPHVVRPGAEHDIILTSAEGGGIRAAAWTALASQTWST